MRLTCQRVLGVMVVAAALGCADDVTGTGGRARVVLDLGPLRNAVTTGDFVTVLATARLTITEDGSNRTVSLALGSSDSAATFNVDVKKGQVEFTLDVLSNIESLLYHGATSVNATADNFQVDMSPVATNAVMVAAPRHPAFTLFDNGRTRSFSYLFQVRNPGSAVLTWRVDSLRPPGVSQILCSVQSTEANCLTSQPMAQGTADSIVVAYVMPPNTVAPPAQGIRLISSVGTASVAEAP